MIKRLSVNTGLVLAIALAVGCTKNENGDQGGKSTLTSFPVEITAHRPGHPDATKTIPYELSEKVYFEPGDQIAMYPGAYQESERYLSVLYTADLETPQPTAVFKLDDKQYQYEEKDYYLAAYPADAVNRWGSSGNSTCYVRLPQPQVAREGSWDSRSGIIAAASKSPVFYFKHCVAYVKFTVTSSTPDIVSLRVAYPGVQNFIVGDANYNDATVSNEIQILYKDEKSVTVAEFKSSQQVLADNYHLNSYLDSKAEIISSDNTPFKEGTYYVAILAKEYKNGLALVFEASDGKCAVKTLSDPSSGSSSLTLAPGDVVTFPSLGTLDFKPALEKHTIWSDDEGENQGVVFGVDDADPSRGLVVSKRKTEVAAWADENVHHGANFDSPIENYNAIANNYEISEMTFPALAYCKNLRDTYGGDWHLPSIEEARILYNSYYGRTYVSPLMSHNQNGYQGHDFRQHPESGQTLAEYQTVLRVKKNFDDLLTEIGDPAPASLDGVNVKVTSGSYSIDPDSESDTYGDNNGVEYWLSKQTKLDGTKKGKTAFFVRFGLFYHYNADKTTNKYVRCIRNVTLQ